MPKYLYLFVLLSFGFSGAAANPDSTAVYDMKAIRIGINTFSLRNVLTGADSLNARHKLHYYLLQDHLYNAALTQNPFTREDYLANLVHRWQIHPKWAVEEHFFTQHNRASQTAVSSATGHLHFEPQPLWSWQTRYSAFGGLRRDARSQRTDLGPQYGGTLEAVWVQPDLSKAADANVYFTRAAFSPRTFQRLITNARYDKQFGTYGSVGIRGEYRQNRTEDYLGNNVQRIQSDTVTVYLNGTYKATEQLSFRTSNFLALPGRAFSYRPLSENTATPANSRYDQFELATLQEILLQQKKLRSSVQFGYKERNRRYANATDFLKDILQNTTTWGLQFTYLLSDRHSLTSQSQGELLRVNTPSETNTEDRDEVFYDSRLVYTARWFPTFRTTMGLAAAYKQYVFIKAAQTAENYTERSLFYEPGFVWAPGRFSWEAQLQLQANYQVRSLLREQLKNRANRTFNQTQVFRYDAGRDLSFQLEYNRRENRLGLLNWERFSESPLDTTISNTLAFFAKKAVRGKKIQSSFRGGYRFFEQRVQGKAGLLAEGKGTVQIYLHTITRQQGPEISYEARSGKGLRLYASLWLQRLQNLKTYRQTEIPFLGSAFTPQELDLHTKNWYPYFDVSLHLPLRFSRYGK